MSTRMTRGMASNVETLDLNFQGIPGAIASYLIRHGGGAVLIEAGPGSTIRNVTASLAAHGLQPSDVTDVLLTHIHLDHAGAAGWFARQGARIHVHPNGAPHLINPEKLITSATRIYGDRMDTLWGEFLPVPEDQLLVPVNGQPIEIGELRFIPLDTPGHANHHYSYLHGDVAFVGDVGGVRLAEQNLRLPMPPPEFHIEKWRGSVAGLAAAFREVGTRFIAPTHFGMYADPERHLELVSVWLDEVEQWMEETMPKGLEREDLRADFIEWSGRTSQKLGLMGQPMPANGAVNPPFMSADGIQRYWQKNRAADVQG